MVQPARMFRFGPFELDVRAGQLRKHGLRLRLPDQSFRVLLLLLEQPGEVVLRDEIQRKLWPNNTVVEFEHSIYAAVKRLRNALGDAGEGPRYIETVAKRGYRFLAGVNVERVAEPDPVAASPAEEVRAPALTDGDRTGAVVSHYSILAKLGEGGMGVVYRAEDLKLGRHVALKFLPLPADEASHNMRERFQREARAASALNHPHICTIYGVEELAGQPAIVMELVEGETLAARLAKGPLSMEKALPLAIQTADALDAAHRRDIVHRDLKPANIMLTKSGVKVLDFGLAKMERSAVGGEETATEVTQAGTILGTWQYMSPEQVQGKETDARSDLFAFGCVLYEMLTGKRAFEGESAASVIASILERDPAPLTTAPLLERIVRRCLAKDPDQRFQTARDLKAALTWAMEQASATLAAAHSRDRRWLVAALIVGVALAGMAALGWLRPRPVQPRTVLRWTVPLAGDPGNSYGVAVSRDGARFAYFALADGQSRIMLRSLDQMEARPVYGSEGAMRPFFSPDGRWLAYFTGMGGALKKVAITGGLPVTLCEDAMALGGSWGDDDRIVFSASGGTVLKQVSASGGKCELLSAPDQQSGETSHRWPQILPGGDSVLLTVGVGRSYDNARIGILDRAKRTVRILVENATEGRYVPSGHLVYVRGGTLFAVPFDLKRLAITGPEAPAVEGVFYNASGGFADYDFAESGLLLYMQETRSTNPPTLDWVDRNGASSHSSLPPQRYVQVGGRVGGSKLRLSPDGKRVAVTMNGSGALDIWIGDLARGTLSRLTAEGDNHQPVWTPDGKRVVFMSFQRQIPGIYCAPVDGSGKAEPLVASVFAYPDGWTPDGKTLLYESTGTVRIWAMTLPAGGGDGKPRMLSEPGAFNESAAQVSPDGRWMAYVSDESGKKQVYVRPYPGPGGKVPISIEAGDSPRWSADGREIFYFDPARNQVMAVAIEGASNRAGTPHALFEQPNLDWDVTPDGKRFLVRSLPKTEASRARLQVVVNWFDELSRKVPAGRSGAVH